MRISDLSSDVCSSDLRRERDTGIEHVVAFHRSFGERPPAATDFEQPASRTQVEPIEDRIDFCPLCILERLPRIGEQRARIIHVMIEPQAIEIIAQNIMCLDDSLGTAAVVAIVRMDRPVPPAPRPPTPPALHPTP